MSGKRGFYSGTLRRLLAEATARAKKNGALEPIQTECRYQDDAGIRFLVRVVQRSSRKPQPNPGNYGDLAATNPFLPYDPRLYVADALPTHVCVLNKYNVVDGHLLIITREFEHQEWMLTEADFEALWRCLAEFDSLGFYNSGVVAGASQPHKHLQIVPVPLDHSGPAVPIESILRAQSVPSGEITEIGALGFSHGIVFWRGDPSADPRAAAAVSVRMYEEMLVRMGRRASADALPRIDNAYNLLVTRQWMLFVPREHECFHGISLNALAFAGALLVHSEDQFQMLHQAGPMAALRSITNP